MSGDPGCMIEVFEGDDQVLNEDSMIAWLNDMQDDSLALSRPDF